MPLIWIRDLDQSTPRALSGTEDARQAFWSPDSRNIGFVVGNVLKRIPADGGPVEEIVRPARDGAWGPDDAILYGLPDNPIQRVSARGGAHTPATVLPSRDWTHSDPSILPDGRHFLYTAKQWTGLAESSQQGIYVGSLDEPSAARRLLPDLSTAVYDGVFSPDTRFVAYNSNQTGRFEVYVTTFPEPRQTWPLTTDGGRALSWRADGKEILVATLTGHIAAYPVNTTDRGFSAGSPQVLVRNVGFDAPYARATADHSRILVRVPRDADKDKGEIRLLFGWAKPGAFAQPPPR
jgi:Tol biopolymer transport system component